MPVVKTWQEFKALVETKLKDFGLEDVPIGVVDFIGGENLQVRIDLDGELDIF